MKNQGASAQNITKPHSSGEGFKGEFSNLSLSDLIQMGTQGKMSLVLHVIQGREEGRIYIDSGEIVHAVCGDETGVEAFYKIMSWKKGTFRTEGYLPPPSQSITLPWEHLLIEAHRWLDEESERLKQSADESSKPLPYLDVISEILTKWGESRAEAKELGLIASEGIKPIFRRENLPASVKALEILRVEATLSKLLSEALLYGSCQEVMLTGESASVVLFFLNPRAQVYAFIEANIYQKAILRMEISELGRKLKKIISDYHEEE